MFRKLLYSALGLCFAFLSTGSLLAQNATITGKVMDSETGETLPGAHVFIENLQRGASTNMKGRFEITDVPAGSYSLTVSFVGYNDFKRNLKIESGQTRTINIHMVPSEVGLDEIVVVGFGEQSRRRVTSSISTIDAEDIGDVTLDTFEGALQGRAAGVQVTGASGVLGSAESIRIRGTTSINASSQPLVVIDGIPVTTNQGGSGTIGDTYGGWAGGGGMNPLININPQDIKSIRVLKDAAATAVYGSRASSGVIMIETKEGIPGRTLVNIDYRGGFTEATNKYDMLNGSQFKQIWNDAVDNAGYPGAFKIQASGADLPSTDWMDLVTQQGVVQQFSGNVSGGDADTRFYISGTYQDQEGYVKRNELKKFSARANIDHTVNEKLRVGLTISPTRTENFRVATANAVAAPFTFGALKAPIVPAYQDNGEPTVLESGAIPALIGTVFPGTPVSNQLGTDFTSTSTQVITSANATYNFTSYLAAKASFSADYLQLEEKQRITSITTDGFPNGYGYASNEQYLNWNLNARVEYNTTVFGDNEFSAMAGMSAQENEQSTMFTEGNTFPNDQLKTLASAADIIGGSDERTSYAFLGYFSRLNLSIQDKYIFEVNGRIEGSSRFGKDNRYGTFPSGSFGWIVSDEPFMDGAEFLSFLKLRASYGLTGNAAISNFPALALAGSGQDYNNVPGIAPSQLANSDLKWETVQQLDVGLDFAFFNNRVDGSIGYYNKVTKDLLLNRPIPSTNGFSTFMQNIGEMKNTGFEFDISADILTGTFKWTSNFNIATNENEVTKLVDSDGDGEGDDIISGVNLVREGEPLGAFYVVEYAGVNPENGMAQYRDADGNIIPNSQFSLAHRKIMGDPHPDFFGGFRNTFYYKGFELSALFQYQQGNEIYRTDGEFTDTNFNSLFNQSTRQMDYWTPDNTDASVPKPIFLANNGSHALNSRYLEDGSYIRLKSATFAYTLPAGLTPDMKIRVYVKGQNLLTFTDFKGMDPEAVANVNNNIRQGDLFFQPPQQRTISFGVNMRF